MLRLRVDGNEDVIMGLFDFFKERNRTPQMIKLPLLPEGTQVETRSTYPRKKSTGEKVKATKRGVIHYVPRKA